MTTEPMTMNTQNAPAEVGIDVQRLVRRLLDEQKTHDSAMALLEKAGVEINTPGLQFDGVEIIADALGVPRDNTVETNACEIANETGQWPDEAYCRDWLWNRWEECLAGDLPIDALIAEMKSEANDQAESRHE